MSGKREKESDVCLGKEKREKGGRCVCCEKERKEGGGKEERKERRKRARRGGKWEIITTEGVVDGKRAGTEGTPGGFGPRICKTEGAIEGLSSREAVVVARGKPRRR